MPSTLPPTKSMLRSNDAFLVSVDAIDTVADTDKVDVLDKGGAGDGGGVPGLFKIFWKFREEIDIS